MQTFIDLFLHLDTLMPQVAAQYGPWIYALLFVIIFAETGLVVTPILPGDSLLFAAGALAATIDPLTNQHVLRVELVLGLLLVAAILGDAVNYSVGHYIGPKVFAAGDDTGLAAQAPEPESPGAGARVLREVRRQGGGARALGADRPHVRAVRRRGRLDDLPHLRVLQRRRRRDLGRRVRRGRLRLRQRAVS